MAESNGEPDHRNQLDYLKLMVQEAREISKARDSYNKLFIGAVIALHTPLFLYLRGGVGDSKSFGSLFWVFLVIFLLVLVLSIVWFWQIQSHKKLNAAKFTEIICWEKAIFGVEHSFFEREYKHYKKDKRRDFSTVEKYLPIFFSCIDGILVLISLLMLCFLSQ